MKNVICKIFGHKLSPKRYVMLFLHTGMQINPEKRYCERCYWSLEDIKGDKIAK